MNRSGVIYILTNLINGKSYIGQTVNFNKRMEEHFSGRRTASSVICSAIKKYGKENFRSEILFQADVTKLDELEIYYITMFDTLAEHGKGYNLHAGGQVKRTFSEETRKRMSEAQMGRKRTPEMIEKHRQKLKGRKYTKEHIEKSVKARQKPVKAVCLTTGKEFYFESVLKATALNISESSIIRALKRTGKSKGYSFSYICKEELSRNNSRELK